MPELEEQQGESRPSDETSSLRKRVAQLQDSVALLNSVLAGDAVLSNLALQCDGLERSLSPMEPTPPSPGGQARDLEGALAAAERAFLDRDEAVPMSLFRRKLDPSRHTQDRLAHYARLLLAHLDHGRRDRIELVVTRLLSVRSPGGELELRARSEVGPYLALVAEASRAKGTARESAIAFFQAAFQRLQSLASVNDFFDTHFLLDMRGYKILLREEMFDPEVLYAAAELNVAITNRLQRFEQQEGLTEEGLRSRFAELDQSVQQAFWNNLRSGRQQPRFDGRDEPAKKVPAKPTPFTPRKPAARPRIGRLRLGLHLAAASVILALGGALLWSSYSARNQLVQIRPEELNALSPLLTSGSLSRGPDQTFFLGQVDPGHWVLLSQAERARTIKDLRRSLWQQKKVRSALVFRGDALVIQIDRGRIVSVQ